MVELQGEEVGHLVELELVGHLLELHKVELVGHFELERFDRLVEEEAMKRIGQVLELELEVLGQLFEVEQLGPTLLRPTLLATLLGQTEELLVE